MDPFDRNALRMRDWNRDFSRARYTGQPDPELPLLEQAAGRAPQAYHGPAAAREAGVLAGRESPVGGGPDRWGYHAHTGGSLPAGCLWHDRMGVWCHVEAPLPGGGWRRVWIRVT